MFEKKENTCQGSRVNVPKRLASAWIVLHLCLLALLAPGWALATEPIDLDPDPDANVTSMTILVDDLDDLDIEALPPGHYIIIVLSPDGSSYTFEVWQ